MSKRIQISPDGTTWYTFPGDKGDMQNTASDIKDTIFGQDFESGQTGMLNWTVSCNGIYKGFAGYVAKILKSGTATAFTTSPATLVSGKTYKITDATKNIWDRLTAVNVFDNAVNKDAEVESVDYLHGQITFKSTYTPTGPITLTGKYLPMTQIAGANSFTLTQNANAIMNTDFEIAQGNDGWQTYEYGLKTVKLSVKGISKASAAFRALVQSRAEMVIEINPDGNSKSVARGFFKPLTSGQSGNVGELEDMTLDFSLSVPDQADVALPYSWVFASDTTLSRALREAILSWQNATLTNVNYLEDGVTGVSGEAVITDLSLSGGLDVMNDFALKFQGSDAPAEYP